MRNSLRVVCSSALLCANWLRCGVRCSLIVVRCWLSVLVERCALFVVCCWLFAGCYRLFVVSVCCLLFCAACCVLIGCGVVFVGR